MSDNMKLLELAAKSLDCELDMFPDGTYDFVTEKHVGDVVKRCWNPLADDGDALRLAVKLGISIYPPQVPKQQGDFAVASLPGDDGKWMQEFIKNGDPYAATRRAIVRAAAAIGEGE